jgi:hypothetical protein
MKMFDNLNLCLFCPTKLEITQYSSFQCLSCPKEANHQTTNNEKYLWCYYFDDNITISVINIVYLNYQLHWSFKNKTTILTDNSNNRVILVELPYLMDFELTEENIANKIKTLLTFI